MEKEQDINFSHFKGNLTRKPILKGNEKKYAILNVACNRPYTNEKGKTVADFISLKVWKDPEKLVNELVKGQKVDIEAHTKTGSYTNDKGEKIYTTDLVVDKIEYTLEKEKDIQEKTEELEK